MTQRRIPLTLRLMRFAFAVAGTIIPGIAGRYAYRLWFSTRRYPEPRRETAWRAQSIEKQIDHQSMPITIYEWGEGPTVLLLHGWNGRGTQLGAFADPLAEAGFRAVAIDFPAHGRTPGNQTNVFAITDAIMSVANTYKPIHAVISHSFGIFPTTLILRHGLSMRCVVCISPPDTVRWLMEGFSKTLRIPYSAQKVMHRLLERRFGHDVWDEVSALKNAAKLDIPALIIHDEHDHDVPIGRGKAVAAAWNGAQFIATKSLGHRRILRDAHVIAQTVKFISS